MEFTVLTAESTEFTEFTEWKVGIYRICRIKAGIIYRMKARIYSLKAGICQINLRVYRIYRIKVEIYRV